MFRGIADNRDDQSLAVRFRRQRFAFFLSLLSRVERPVHILDIGGTEGYWKTMAPDQSDQMSITLLNLTAEALTLPNLKNVIGDARSIPADQGQFDIVFSNSVIEHVGTYDDQLRMANEVRRVGKRYFIQTPNRYFPLEPHFLFPFFQFLPLRIRVCLLRHFDLGWFPKTPERQEAQRIVESITLLDRRSLVSLFPSANIYEEKILGMTKSFIAYGGWN